MAALQVLNLCPTARHQLRVYVQLSCTERATDEYIVEANASSTAACNQVGTRYAPSAFEPVVPAHGGAGVGSAYAHILVSVGHHTRDVCLPHSHGNWRFLACMATCSMGRYSSVFRMLTSCCSSVAASHTRAADCITALTYARYARPRCAHAHRSAGWGERRARNIACAG